MCLMNKVKLNNKPIGVSIGCFGNLLSFDGFCYGNDSKTTRPELVEFLTQFNSDQLAIIVADLASYLDRKLYRF